MQTIARTIIDDAKPLRVGQQELLVPISRVRVITVNGEIWEAWLPGFLVSKAYVHSLWEAGNEAFKHIVSNPPKISEPKKKPGVIVPFMQPLNTMD